MSPHVRDSSTRARAVAYDKNSVTLALNTGLQMSSTLGPTPVRLKIWQQNLNRSRAAHEDLINSDVFRHFDILTLQEPYIDKLGNTKAMKDWRVVYLSSHLTDPAPIQAVMLVNVNIDTNKWVQLSIQGMGDLVTIQIYDACSKITIFRLYNDCHHAATTELLDTYSKANSVSLHSRDTNHVLWCGNFNRHHPMWDKEQDSQLFTARAIREAEVLLTMVADHGMVMALPKNIPTLESMSTKNWTRPDNMFCSANTEAMLVSCMTDPWLRGPGTDHIPILTTLEFSAVCTTSLPSYNFRAMDWDEFNNELAARLTDILIPVLIVLETDFHEAVGNLTGVIQDTIHTTVQLSTPSPHSKQWWNKKLESLT